MKTSELIGGQLDYWVARANGKSAVVTPDGVSCYVAPINILRVHSRSRVRAII